MKMKIFILAYLVSVAALAQNDGYNQSPEVYRAIQAKTEQLTEPQTRTFADFLVSQTPYVFSFERKTETSTSLTYIYTFDEAKIRRFGADILTVEFAKDADLYNFRALKIMTEGADAIYIWIRVFLPTATFDLVRENYKFRDLISVEEGVWIRLLNGDEIKKFTKEKTKK